MFAEAGRGIDRFLFMPLRADAAALFRIALASMVVFVFWPNPHLLARNVAGPELRAVQQQIVASGLYWSGVLMAAGLFATGVYARRSGAVLAALLLPLVPVHALFVGRRVLWTALVAFCFVRSDARLSVVRRPRPGDTAGPCWPVRVIQLQLAVLYGANAIAKTTPEYLSGEVPAILMTALPNFRVRPSGDVLSLAGAAVPLWLGAGAVVLTEYALAVGFWFRRTKWITAALGVAFHTSLRYVVAIGYLDVVSVFLYSAFLLPLTHEEPRSAQAGAVHARPTPGLPTVQH